MFRGRANELEGKRWMSPTWVEFKLSTRRTVYVFVSALTMTGLSLAYVGGRVAVVDLLANSRNTWWLEKAIELDPSNPAPYYRLGAIQLFSMEKADSFAAIDHLRRAAELSPNSGPYWLALAAASESLGDSRAAQDALQQALERRPMSPPYWWTAANFYLRNGRREQAWDSFRRLLELSPGYAEAVFHLCHRTADDSRAVAERVLPPSASPKLKLAYVGFLSRQGEYADAFRAWQQFASEAPRSKVTFATAQPYIENLLSHSRFDEAKAVWTDLLKSQIVSQPPSTDSGDAVFNGDFEQAPLNAGFDWRTPQLPYVVTDLQAPAANRGAKSARVDFTVRHNEEYEILYQFVPVEPGCAYRLRAFVRSEGITSDSGPRLRVVDAASPARLDVATPPVIGTTDWHPIELVFSTGSDTRMVRLAVWRARSRTFPTEISGSFWIDAVSMIALGPQGELALTRQAPLP